MATKAERLKLKKGQRTKLADGTIIVSDGRGGGRKMTAEQDAENTRIETASAKIKRETASGKAPPIPAPVVRTPTTQTGLNRLRGEEKKKKKVVANSADNKAGPGRGLRALPGRGDTVADLIKQGKGK